MTSGLDAWDTRANVDHSSGGDCFPLSLGMVRRVRDEGVELFPHALRMTVLLPIACTPLIPHQNRGLTREWYRLRARTKYLPRVYRIRALRGAPLIESAN